MRVLEILLMTLAGIWQGVRQDFNLLEIAMVAAGVVAWRRGWRPRAASVSHPPEAVAVRDPAGDGHGGAAPGDPPAAAASGAGGGGRIQPSTAGRYAAPWARRESDTSFLAAFRNDPRDPAAALRIELFSRHRGDAGGGNGPGARSLGRHSAECAIFLAVLYWMLRGWMPARWALFGVVLAALRFGIASYWVNSY